MQGGPVGLPDASRHEVPGMGAPVTGSSWLNNPKNPGSTVPNLSSSVKNVCWIGNSYFYVVDTLHVRNIARRPALVSFRSCVMV